TAGGGQMRSAKLLVLCSLVLVLLAGPCFSQAPIRYGYINGQVFFRDGQPASYIEVRLEGYTTGINMSVITDPAGRVTFSGLLAGKMYTLMIEAHDYKPVRRTVDLTMTHAFESVTLEKEPSTRTKEVPPEGAGATVNARLAQISEEAKKEFEAGRISLNT